MHRIGIIYIEINGGPKKLVLKILVEKHFMIKNCAWLKHVKINM